VTKFEIYETLMIVIADVCANAVIRSMGQVLPHEWVAGVIESDELASA
jgi:hypothetical protein